MTDEQTEHEQKHVLTEWLADYGATVWWEEKNEWQYPTFQIERGGHIVPSKPDLVIKADVTLVCEFKRVGKSTVYDALLQLYGYWLSHATHDQQYVCDGEPVEIDGFVTATRNSISGHLFSGDDEQMLPTQGYGDGRKRAIRIGELPRHEWNMTEQHVRQLWRLQKRALETNDTIQSVPAIGSLLSTVIDGDADPTPAVLWSHGGEQEWRPIV